MTDIEEHVPSVATEPVEEEHNASGVAETTSSDVSIAQPEGQIAAISSEPENEIHEDEDHDDFVTVDKPAGVDANGTEPAGARDASGVEEDPKERQGNGEAKDRTTAGDAAKNAKKTSAATKVPLGKTGKSSAAPTPLVKKVREPHFL